MGGEEFEPRQLVIVHAEVWKQLEAWAAAKNCRFFVYLAAARTTCPLYALTPLEMTQ